MPTLPSSPSYGQPTAPPPPGHQWGVVNGKWVPVPNGQGGNFDIGGGAKGAATGALAGGMIGGPWGALAGGVGGFALGGMAGQQQKNADATRRGAMEDAISRQSDLQREMDARRERDLVNTMAFYGPAMSSLSSLYGIPQSAWGPAAPGNAPVAAPKTGMVNGMPAAAAPMKPDMKPFFGGPLGGAMGSLPAGTRLAAPRRPLFSKMGRLG